jgi:hypothetical protein
MAIATAALTTGHRNIPAVLDLGKLCIMTPWRYPGGQAHRPAHIFDPGPAGRQRHPEARKVCDEPDDVGEMSCAKDARAVAADRQGSGIEPR